MTAPHYQDNTVTLHHGDCLNVLAELPDQSVHAVVTDPPYGLEFMGKAWDRFDEDSKARAGMSRTGYTDGAERLERPSFLGGLNPRCRICQKWQRGGNPCTCETPDFPNERRARSAAFGDWCQQWATECLRILKPGGHLLAFGGTRTWHRLTVAVEDAGFEIRDSIAWLYGSGFPKSRNIGNGLGTALKPAFEPIVVARKPLSGTVAANVHAHGVGALNIDGCRVGDDTSRADRYNGKSASGYSDGYRLHQRDQPWIAPAGRWPANVILDESQAAALDEQSGPSVSKRSAGRNGQDSAEATWGLNRSDDRERGHNDSGGASRFFYTAKADQAERITHNGIAHPTVKPLDLMRWLVRLATPPGGTILEPFAGSGTTVEAAILEGFRCIAIEREADYLPLITQRIHRRRDPVKYLTAAGDDLGLFADEDGAA